MMGLAGKTALVTGGNQGIGWAIAEAFAAHGARVVVNYPEERWYPGHLAELGAEASAINLSPTHTAFADGFIDARDRLALQSIAR